MSGSRTTNSAIPAASSPVFIRSSLSAKINALWFLSLAFSLMTASLAMLVKQWLREYMSHDSVSPKAYVRVRHFRSQALGSFKVFEIAELLPMLLQLALALFFVGLALFLLELDGTIGWIVSSFLLLWGTTLVITTLGPSFSNQCPYKTPFLEPVFEGVRKGILHLCSFCVAAFNPNYNLSQYDIHSYRKQSVKIYLAKFWDLGRDLNVYVQKRLSLHLPHTPYFSTFRYRMLSFRHWHPFVNESLIRASPSLDIPSLVAADNIFMDDDFLAIAARCISNADLHDAVSFTRSALLNRLGSNLDNIASSAVREYFRGYPSTASLLRGAVLDALIGTLHKLDSQRGMDGIGAIIELKEAKLYQVLSFLTATSYTSRKEDIGKACSKLFCINSDMAAHIVYVVCQQLNEVNYLESIRINTDQALANFSSGIEIWATYYTRLLNGVPNPDPIDDHCARIGNTPDKLAFVFLSLLQRVRDDLLLGHERTLKQVQGKLAFVLERIDRLERNNDDESILIMYCDGRDVSDKPLRLLLELEDRVPGIIEPRLGTALSAVSSWSSQPLLPQTVEPNEATDISRLTGIIVEHCASIAEPEAESVYGKDDMEE
ncbi:hypothetical protein C8Q75DRAFT_154052 [Abortiporus biennis]|nr:hypothetical protein C8Q75DRAFT_154052 [Abortiporus biennis]